jgi:hypothetical protein
LTIETGARVAAPGPGVGDENVEASVAIVVEHAHGPAAAVRIRRKTRGRDVDEVSCDVADVEPVERIADLAEPATSAHRLVEIDPLIPVQIRRRDPVKVPGADAPIGGRLASQRASVLIDADARRAAVVRGVEIEQAVVAGWQERDAVADAAEGGAGTGGRILEAQRVGDGRLGAVTTARGGDRQSRSQVAMQTVLDVSCDLPRVMNCQRRPMWGSVTMMQLVVPARPVAGRWRSR